MLLLCGCVAEIRDSFNMFDKNGDGQISSEELGSVMVSLGQRASAIEIKNYIRAVDTDSKSVTIATRLYILLSWR